MIDERRVRVQGDREPKKPAGTVAWWEHVKAWEGYAEIYGKHYQSAERIAERGGFGYAELVEFLGHEPETWEPR